MCILFAEIIRKCEKNWNLLMYSVLRFNLPIKHLTTIFSNTKKENKYEKLKKITSKKSR